MAMINCPECNKEVSDKAPACIYCGNPLSSTINNINTIVSETQTIFIDESKDKSDVIEQDISEISEYKTNRKKWIVPVIIAIVIISTFSIIWYINNNLQQAKQIAEEEYLENTRVFASLIYEQSRVCYSMFSTISDGWSDIVLDSGYSYSPIIAITAIYNLEEVKDAINDVKKGKIIIDSQYNKLSNPPQKYEETYNLVCALYSNYEGIFELITNQPTDILVFMEEGIDLLRNFSEDNERLQNIISD